MNDLSKASVVLPSLDPDEKLTAVIDGLLEYGFTDIILVNDGSKAENLHYFEDAAAQHPEITLLHHEVNRGKGAALKTAFSWFLENRPNSLGVVTVDGDNQHHPEDTRACAMRMMEGGKLVLGVRDFSQPDVPARSRSGNRITSLVFKIFVGMTITDTQTGLRAIPTKDVRTLLGIYGDRFEYETNMLLAMKKHNIGFEEVKIRTVYIEENKSSHFRAVRDSWRIYKLILAHFFRYSLSAIVSAIIDTGIFSLLTAVLHPVLAGFLLSAIPTAIARTASSLCNFFMNKKLVFDSNVETKKAMLRYYMIAIPNMLLQAGLTSGIIGLLSIPEDAVFLRTVIYVVVMCVLFVATFMLQQRWVFANNPKTEE